MCFYWKSEAYWLPVYGGQRANFTPFIAHVSGLIAYPSWTVMEGFYAKSQNNYTDVV